MKRFSASLSTIFILLVLSSPLNVPAFERPSPRGLLHSYRQTYSTNTELPHANLQNNLRFREGMSLTVDGVTQYTTSAQARSAYRAAQLEAQTLGIQRATLEKSILMQDLDLRIEQAEADCAQVNLGKIKEYEQELQTKKSDQDRLLKEATRNLEDTQASIAQNTTMLAKLREQLNCACAEDICTTADLELCEGVPGTGAASSPANDELERLRQRDESMAAEITELEQKLAELKPQITSKVEAINTYNAEFNAMLEQLDALERKSPQKSEEILELTAQVSTKRQGKAELETDLKDSLNQMEGQKGTLRSLLIEIQGINVQLKVLKKKVQAEAASSSEKDQQKQSLRQQKFKIMSHINTLVVELENLEIMKILHETEVQEYSVMAESMKAVEGKYTSYRDVLAQEQAEARTAKEKFDASNIELDKLKAQLQQQKENMVSLTDQIATLSKKEHGY